MGKEIESKLQDIYNKHCWQPFTQMKLAPPPILIKKAKGVYLFNFQKKAIIDAIGSWWVCIHGHANTHLQKAIKRQFSQVEHVIFAGLAHEPAIRLSQKLAQSTQNQLSRAFFSDNGSTAVEIAIKMAYQYYFNQGQKERQEFVSLAGGYHGDTFGAMSIGNRDIFHQAFAPLLFPCHSIPSPSCPFEVLFDEKEASAHCAKSLNSFYALVQKRSHKICALILEPIIQGASASFHFYPPYFLKKLYEICQENKILLIADEVFTGCGRTGSFYASEKAKIWPDIIALSKGLTSGYASFAVTLTKEKIYKAFYSDDRNKTLLHGHSMTANPIGCATAIASLELLEKREGLRQVQRIETWHKAFQADLEKNQSHRIQECRYMGSVGAIHLKTNASYNSSFAWNFMKKALAKGVLLRPLGNVIYICPPYPIKEKELGKVYSVLEEVLEQEVS